MLLSRREEVRALRLSRSGLRGIGPLRLLAGQVRRRVIAFVRAQPPVRELLAASRTRVLGVDAHVAAAGFGRLLVPRHAEVAIYDYDRNVLILAIVDLKRERLEAIKELPGRQPPPSAAEIREGVDLALQVRRAARVSRKRPRAVVHPARQAAMRGHRLFGHRAFEVRFIESGGRRSTPILVDLSRRTVLAGKGV